MQISKVKIFLKRLCLFLGFFLLFSIILNSLFLGIIATSDWDFTKRLESLNFDNPDYEILVFGTSLPEYGLDTELLTLNGMKSFNLAFVGNTMQTCYIQLNEYLTNYVNKPKYVLLPVNSFLERLDNNGIQPVIEFTMKGHKYNKLDIPISKFRWAGLEIIKKAFRKEYRLTYLTYGQKKSVIIEPDHTITSPDLLLDIKKVESSKWIGEIAKLCEMNHIKLIVMDIPGIRETINNSDIGPYLIHFNNGHSAIFYNFSSRAFCKFIDAKKDWCGFSHFNKYGAEKFTREISKIIFNN